MRKAAEEDTVVLHLQKILALFMLYTGNFCILCWLLPRIRGSEDSWAFSPLFSLEDEIARDGRLIYRRDDIEGSERTTELSARHSKIYKSVPKLKEMKSQTL